MMNAHPEISFATDPYRPFFNDFRDALAERAGLLDEDHRQAPLASYFCDDDELSIMKLVQGSDMNLAIPPDRLKYLIPVIAQRAVEAVPVRPIIADRMDRLQGRTYKELYESMMALVGVCYGKKDARLVGMKEVWCTEFIRPLIQTSPGMKCLVIVRDPRAVFASNHAQNQGTERYPWLFLVRQWRKLVTFASLFSTDPSLKDSVLVLRYEDLVSNPGETGQEICSFLGVNYSEDMIDARKFKDGAGKAWRQNSSHGTSEKITKTFTEKWKEVLNEAEVKLIEKLCYPEMRLFGYEPIHQDSKEIGLNDVWNPLIIPKSELALWIRKYANTDLMFNVAEMMKEYSRKRLLASPQSEVSRLDLRIIEAFYLDRRHFEDLRSGKKQWGPGGVNLVSQAQSE